MSKPGDHPVTRAIRVLTERQIAFEVLAYRYEPRGGTRHSSAELGVDEHRVIKTLIMETDAGKPLVVLMHGDREVSTKNLARTLGVKAVKPCEPATADRYSGYFVGGTSPFGTRRAMPVYAEATIFELNPIYINAGHRGFMLRMDPADIRKVLDVTEVNVAVERTA
ncbi:MAG: aminoacyl-tRNA deacylase [Planctomycetes bacterium]|nr:aminoacyl-tRNA deacylase [Planctomycetota bacterium]